MLYQDVPFQATCSLIDNIRNSHHGKLTPTEFTLPHCYSINLHMSLWISYLVVSAVSASLFDLARFKMRFVIHSQNILIGRLA
jgi:hypothetical protein